ncbi:NUDIX hydrolase [Bradyrhizobium sp. AZCC 2289]|uniref:NUDIX hydrolase n=1 Tax=Bradyrhizobium sp. AZCC 2289 TaxID=3117026 RepID=UPI002FEE7F04
MMSGTIEIVAALIRDPAGRVLLVRKRGTTAFMQPGGKRDSGEDDVTALAREIDEELGCRLVPDSIQRLGEFDAVSANEPGFRVRASLYEIDVTGHIAPQAEIEAMVWVDPAAPADLPLAPLTRDHVLPLASQRRAAGAV